MMYSDDNVHSRQDVIASMCACAGRRARNARAPSLDGAGTDVGGEADQGASADSAPEAPQGGGAGTDVGGEADQGAGADSAPEAPQGGGAGTDVGGEADQGAGADSAPEAPQGGGAGTDVGGEADQGAGADSNATDASGDDGDAVSPLRLLKKRKRKVNTRYAQHYVTNNVYITPI